jgi:predicted double-glycine peptidase
MKLISPLTILLVVLVFGIPACGQATVEDPPWVVNSTRCGANCLFMLLKIKNYPVDFDPLIRSLEIGPRGLSLDQLRQAASRVGLRTRVVKCDADRLGRLPMPVIAHLKDSPLGSSGHNESIGHYVVLLSANPGQKFDVIDGSFAIRTDYLPEKFLEYWDGYLLVPDESIGAADVLYPAVAGILLGALGLRWARRRRSGTGRLPAWAARPRWLPFLLLAAVSLTPPSARAEAPPAPAGDDGQIWRVESHDGANCLALFLNICGKPVDYQELRKALVGPKAQDSLSNLCATARRHGLAARVVTTNPAELRTMDMPAIVHLDSNPGGSFCLIYEVGDQELRGFAGDNMRWMKIPMEEFRRSWSGYALVPQAERGSWLWSTTLGLLAMATYGRVRMGLGRRASRPAGPRSEAGRPTPVEAV